MKQKSYHISTTSERNMEILIINMQVSRKVSILQLDVPLLLVECLLTAPQSCPYKTLLSQIKMQHKYSFKCLQALCCLIVVSSWAAAHICVLLIRSVLKIPKQPARLSSSQLSCKLSCLCYNSVSTAALSNIAQQMFEGRGSGASVVAM